MSGERRAVSATGERLVTIGERRVVHRPPSTAHRPPRTAHHLTVDSRLSCVVQAANVRAEPKGVLMKKQKDVVLEVDQQAAKLLGLFRNRSERLMIEVKGTDPEPEGARLEFCQVMSVEEYLRIHRSKERLVELLEAAQNDLRKGVR